MLVFVERQGLAPGRGIVLQSFPDPGAALIYASLSREGMEAVFLEGVHRWVRRLLADPHDVAEKVSRHPERYTRAARLLGRSIAAGRENLEHEFDRARSLFLASPGRRYCPRAAKSPA